MRKKDLKFWNEFPESKKEELKSFFNLTDEGLEASIRFKDNGEFTLDHLKFIYKPNNKYDYLSKIYESNSDFKILFGSDSIPEPNENTMEIIKTMHNDFFRTIYKYKKFSPKYLWRYKQLVKWLHGLNRDAYKLSGGPDYITTVRLLRTHLHIFFTDCKMI